MPLTYSMSDFVSSYAANIFILTILFDFCSFHIKYIWKVESRGAENLLQSHYLVKGAVNFLTLGLSANKGSTWVLQVMLPSACFAGFLPLLARGYTLQVSICKV
jgi:hypothetical protein